MIGVDYVHTHSEQEKKDEKRMPMLALKDDRAKTIMAKVSQSKGVVDNAVGVVKSTIEQLGVRESDAQERPRTGDLGS